MTETAALDCDLYLEPSPHSADGSEKVGKLPRSIPTDDLAALGHPKSPIKAIRAKCVDCCVGDLSEVRKCVATSCPLWPFRMGKNPFWGKDVTGAEPSFEGDAP